MVLVSEALVKGMRTTNNLLRSGVLNLRSLSCQSNALITVQQHQCTQSTLNILHSHAGAASLQRYSAHTGHSALTNADPVPPLALQALPSVQLLMSVSAAAP